MRGIEKRFERFEAALIGGFVFSGLMSLAVLGGLGYVVYRILAHFGIL